MSDAYGAPFSFTNRRYGDEEPYPHIVCFATEDGQMWEHYTYLTDAEARVTKLRDDPTIRCIIFAETNSYFRRVLEEVIF
jgi:hypothetical protein